MVIKTLVFGLDANGDSDVFFCKIECDQSQFDEGIHIEAVEKIADENGYEPQSGDHFFVIDETDRLFKNLNCDEKFAWETADIHFLD